MSVEHSNLPGGGVRIPLCPTPPEVPHLPPADCCVVESSAGLSLLCDPKSHPWNGKNVSEFGQCIDTPSGRMCVLSWADEYGSHTLELAVCPPPPAKVPPPSTGEIPPAPEPVPVPLPPGPRLPPPTQPPAAGCESEEASRCRARWDEMVSAPVKLTKCDHKWIAVLERLRTGKGRAGPGRRASSLKLKSGKRPRKYGHGGIPDSARKYARFPGLRGGRRVI